VKQKKTEVVPGASARYSGSIKGKQQHEWQDAIDKAFAALESQGIVARHDLADCQTAAVDAIDYHIAEFARRGGSPIGYTFYHGQDTLNVTETGELLLAYGSIDRQKRTSIEIGKVVRDALIAQGLPVKWNESIFKRIATWVQGPVPDGYGDVETAEALPGFPTDKHFELFIEAIMVSEGFTRESGLELPESDLMVFSGGYPIPIIVDYNGFGITLQCGLSLPESQNLKKLSYAIERMNDTARVLEFIIRPRLTVIMSAKVGLPNIKCKLGRFVQQVKEDLDMFFSHTKQPKD